MPVIGKNKNNPARISLAACLISLALNLINLLIFWFMMFTDVLAQKLAFVYYFLGVSIAVGLSATITSIVFGVRALSQKTSSLMLVFLSMMFSFMNLMDYAIMLLLAFTGLA